MLVLWTAAFVIAGLAECGSHLLALFGTPQAYLDHCGSAIPTGWAMVGSDVATDVITLILPIPMVSCPEAVASKASSALLTLTSDLVAANASSSQVPGSCNLYGWSSVSAHVLQFLDAKAEKQL